MISTVKGRIMKKVFVSFCALIFVAFTYATPLSGDEKKDFLKTSHKACFAKQRGAATNRARSDAQLHEYCSCYTNRLADVVSVEDFKEMFKTKSTDSIESRANTAGNYCIERFTKKLAIKSSNATAKIDTLSICNSASSYVNETTPKIVDKNTILLSSLCTRTGAVVTLEYLFSLNFGNLSVSQTNLDGLKLKMLNHWCTTPKPRELLNLMNVEGLYCFPDGRYIGKLTFNKKEC